jgi:hypothetical protein
MTCNDCGEEASGRFCGRCGAATDQRSPADIADPVSVTVAETAIPVMPDEPADTPIGPGSVTRRLRGMKRGRAIGLAVIAVIVVAVVGAVLTSRGSGEPTSAQLAAGSRALAQVGSPGDSLTFKDNQLIAHLAPVSMETNADGSFVQDLGPWVDSALSTVWKSVPGTYESVCVEADNVKSSCMDATALTDKYGPRAP